MGKEQDKSKIKNGGGFEGGEGSGNQMSEAGRAGEAVGGEQGGITIKSKIKIKTGVGGDSGEDPPSSEHFRGQGADPPSSRVERDYGGQPSFVQALRRARGAEDGSGGEAGESGWTWDCSGDRPRRVRRGKAPLWGKAESGKASPCTPFEMPEIAESVWAPGRRITVEMFEDEAYRRVMEGVSKPSSRGYWWEGGG